MGIRIDYKVLRELSSHLGERIGLSSKDAFILADSLIFANLWGIDSHGIIRLPFYLKRLEACGTNIKPCIKKIKNKSALVLLDGDNGMGQVVGTYAAILAAERALESGICYVAVKGSSHFGAASYYAYQIAKQNMIGIVLSNSASVMTAWGGARRIIGNNPLAFVAPYEPGKPILLDIAMSGVAGGKVRLYAKNNKKIPKGWILNKDGQNTTNPNELLAGGTLLPFGQHKGYGLAVAIEILTGVMTGAGMLTQIPLWIKDMTNPLNIGHVFIAINIADLMDFESYKERLYWMIQKLKSSPLAEGFNQIYFPGEIEQSTLDQRTTEGIPLSEEIWNDLIGLSRRYGVELPNKDQ